MSNELEINFGRALQIVVTHLIKNAKTVPPPVLQGALAFEASTWDKLALSDKQTRLRTIAELTEAPSEIHRHFDAYPHKFSKERYAEYLTLLRLYKEALGG